MICALADLLDNSFYGIKKQKNMAVVIDSRQLTDVTPVKLLDFA